jgi:lipoprotein-anchoring transpeptidase ErfK/SrfK
MRTGAGGGQSVAYGRGVMKAPRRRLSLSSYRLLVPLVLLACAVAACAPPLKSSTAGSASPPSSTAPTSSAPVTSAAAASSSPTTKAIPVHVALLESDGVTYGIGMPIIAYFSQTITDSAAFLKATTVKINGQPANGAWFFEQSTAKGPGFPLEAHYRPQNFWPGDSTIQLNMPINGLSGGGSFVFDDSLTLSIVTGDAHTATVNANTERMTVYDNAKLVRMIGTGSDHYDLLVPWSVRMTNSGEYIHAASWNGGNIGIRSTSNGCTNLNTADAQWYYNFALVGDPVTYVNTTGGPMPFDDGYGDWNVAWSTWQAGGAVQASS